MITRVRIPVIYSNEILKGLEDNYFTGGMIPKLEACATALKNKVPLIHIIDGRIENSILLSLLTNEDIGTKIIPI